MNVYQNDWEPVKLVVKALSHQMEVTDIYKVKSKQKTYSYMTIK